MRGLSVVAASGGHSSSRCAGLSLSRPLLLRSRGSRRAGSAVVAHGPSCSAACGTFPDQGSNPCPLHWQADSQPLRHQGSPDWHFLTTRLFCCHSASKSKILFLFLLLSLGYSIHSEKTIMENLMTINSTGRILFESELLLSTNFLPC